MDNQIITAISDQVQREFTSAYVYLAMAGYTDELNLPGFTHWLHLQAAEEKDHAMRLMTFISDRGGRVKLQAIEEPRHDYKDIRDLFNAIFDHEQMITGHINDLYGLAVEKKDYATQVELQWFINEQVEEEKNVSDIIGMLNLVKDSPQGIFELDRQLAQRGPAPAPAED